MFGLVVDPVDDGVINNKDFLDLVLKSQRNLFCIDVQELFLFSFQEG